MAILLYARSASSFCEPGLQGAKVVAHIERTWPGTFLILACQDRDAAPDPRLACDWIILPPEDWLALEILRAIEDTFDVRARIFLSAPPGALKEVPTIQIETPTTGAIDPTSEDLTAKLDSFLELVHPAEFHCGPFDKPEDVRASLAAHPSAHRAQDWIVHWRGAPGSRLSGVIDALFAAGQARIQIRLLLADILAIRRQGLQTTLGDALLSPPTLARLARFVLDAAPADPRITFRILTESPRPYVHKAVAIGTRALGLVRRALGLWS